MADETIASSVRVDGSIVYRTKRQFVEGNLDKVLNEEPRPGASRKLPGKEEALLVATACSRPPEGRAPPGARVGGRGAGERERGVWGRSVVVRVVAGGRCIITKKKN